MRVIAGSAKGRRLKGPRRGDAVRPVLDQVKESIFSILFDVRDLQVLDCYAGTGAIGIEALSRGAAHAVFIEFHPRTARLIAENLAYCKLADRGTILTLPAERALRVLGKRDAAFDLIFVDPPYERGLVNPTLHRICDRGLLRPQARVIIEHHPHEVVHPPTGLVLRDQRKYGQTHISFLDQEDPT
jgi:16S rRNA (guanine966-N2)-methyltransferase